MSTNALITLGLAVLLTAGVAALMWLPKRNARISLAGIMIIAALSFAWLHRAQWHAFNSDAPFHLSLIQATANQGAFPGDPFFEGDPAPLHYSLLHLIGGGIAVVTGSVEMAWFVMGMLYLAVAGWTGYRWGYILRPCSTLPAVGAFWFILLAGATLSVPSFSRLAGLLALLALSFVSDNRRSILFNALIVGALFGAAISVRLFTGGIGLLCFWIWIALERQRSPAWRMKFATIAGATALLIATPWLRNLAGMSTEGIEGMVAGDSALAALANYGEDIRAAFRMRAAMAPYPWLRVLLGLIQVAGLLVLVSYRIYPKHGARRLFRWGLIALAVFLLPWRSIMIAMGVEEYLAVRMLDIVGRVLNLFPVALSYTVLLGAVTTLYWRAWSLPARWRRFANPYAIMVLTAGVLLLACFPAASRIRLMLEYGRAVRPRFELLHAGKSPAVFDQLRNRTVLSDPWTSYMTQYALGTWCFTVPAGHSSGRVDVETRAAQVRDFLAGTMNATESRVLLERHAIDYVLVNRRLADGRGIPYFGFPVPVYDAIDMDYLRHHPQLQIIYEDPDILLFNVTIERDQH